MAILGESSATPIIEAALVGLTPVRWQDATIVARQPQTPNITSFLLRPVTPFQWYAGQHVDIRLTAADGYRAVRSYSIASAPNDGLSKAGNLPEDISGQAELPWQHIR